VGELETLDAIARLSLLTNNVENRVDELSPLCVMVLCSVVARAGLAENKVVWVEDLAVGTSTNGVHGDRLEIHEHSAGHITPSSGLVVVDVDAFKVEIRVTIRWEKFKKSPR
jgi:hypothetical protein